MLSSGSVGKQHIVGPSRLPAIMPEAESAAQSGDATTKALGTDELLLLVLEKVPVHDRLPLLRVSKKWNSITSSIGYVVKPTSLDTFKDSLSLLENLAPGPRFATNGSMRVNPAINSSVSDASLSDMFALISESAKYSKNLRMDLGVTVVLEGVCEPSKLMSKRHEFITYPPINMVMLGLKHPYLAAHSVKDYTSTAILRENTGIRIGQLLETFEKMRAHRGDARWPECEVDFTTGQPVAFFAYCGPMVVSYLDGWESRFEKQPTDLAKAMRILRFGDFDDSEDGTQEGSEDDNESGEGGDEDGDKDDNEDEHNSDESNNTNGGNDSSDSNDDSDLATVSPS